MNRPDGLAFDSSNGVLFFSEPACHRVRAFPMATGIIATVVGTGGAGLSGDGQPGTAAMLNSPRGLCLDSYFDLYITGALMRVLPSRIPHCPSLYPCRSPAERSNTCVLSPRVARFTDSANARVFLFDRSTQALSTCELTVAKGWPFRFMFR